jgi:hypothetical protein
MHTGYVHLNTHTFVFTGFVSGPTVVSVFVAFAMASAPLLRISKDQQQFLMKLNNFTLTVFSQLKLKSDGNILFSPLALLHGISLLTHGQPHQRKEPFLQNIGLDVEEFGRFEQFSEVLHLTLLQAKQTSAQFSLNITQQLYIHNDRVTMTEQKSKYGTIWTGKFGNIAEIVQDNRLEGCSSTESEKTSREGESHLFSWNEFVSKWKYRFENSEEDGKAGLMRLRGLLGVNMDPMFLCLIINIPFADDRFSFIVFHRQDDYEDPDDIDDLARAVLGQWRWQLSPVVPQKTPVNLIFPAVNISHSEDITNVLKSLKLNGEHNIIHASHISSIIITPNGEHPPEPSPPSAYGKPDPLELNLSSGFQFMIMDNKSGAILFYGRIRDANTFQKKHDEL